MSRLPVRFALAAGLLVSLATTAAAQPAGTACTSPNDPACTHLKCYRINDKASTIPNPTSGVANGTVVLQVSNQFGTEVLYRLQPYLLCVPSVKACCCPGPACQAGASGCSVANCAPNPVNAPGLPHFKCYKIKAKTCPNGDCAQKAVGMMDRLVEKFQQLREELGITSVLLGEVGELSPVLERLVGS